MAWVIGIDEAGYGPNLGPFVMTAVTLQVPDPFAEADLWNLLRGAVRRAAEPVDGRIPVGDSKAIYSPGRGLGPLEGAVLALLPPANTAAVSLQHYVDSLAPLWGDLLRCEPWYTGTTALPVEASADLLVVTRELWALACRKADVTLGPVRAAIICPERFNELAEAADSKGAVLHHALAELVRANWILEGEPVLFVIDKHGGRNTYAVMLQDIVPEGMVVTHREDTARSVYSVQGLNRMVRWTFQPRADAEHFPVALASMVSKYLRELLMNEFNAFWRKHVPGLKPTAGYPADARRFYKSIHPLLPGLGLEENAVWRRR